MAIPNAHSFAVIGGIKPLSFLFYCKLNSISTLVYPHFPQRTTSQILNKFSFWWCMAGLWCHLVMCMGLPKTFPLNPICYHSIIFNSYV